MFPILLAIFNTLTLLGIILLVRSDLFRTVLSESVIKIAESTVKNCGPTLIKLLEMVAGVINGFKSNVENSNVARVVDDVMVIPFGYKMNMYELEVPYDRIASRENIRYIAVYGDKPKRQMKHLNGLKLCVTPSDIGAIRIEIEKPKPIDFD